MLFCSQPFLIFFSAVFLVYWLTPWREVRVWVLLLASYYFYMRWNHQLAALVTATSFVDYVLARLVERAPSTFHKRFYLILSLVMNLGLLVYFKYANFFIASFCDALRAANVTVSLPVLQVILPVGISFYTFEAINYMVDVYRGKMKAERNVAHFLLFILFFPHLIAGPIVRARDFLCQINRRKRWSWARLHLGAQLFLLGVFKKLVLADHMASFVDPVFADPHAYNSSTCWLSLVAYALQIYGDFSGYSDMALGTAHLLGYKLAVNFNMPYLAANIAEFWRRWHISLSSWLRDYLFIPLGGSRGDSRQTARNLLLTMTLGGLWHGANWTFIVWGVLHGTFLIIHRAFRAYCETRAALDRTLRSVPGTVLRMGITFLCAILGWVLFRSTSLSQAGVLFGRLFTPVAGLASPVAMQVFVACAGFTVLCHALSRSGLWARLILRAPPPVLGCFYALAISVALLLSSDHGKLFIYFQF
jgi:alginate O-acetyltransferase complex protein AlgI